jgi:hypothetical protein
LTLPRPRLLIVAALAAFGILALAAAAAGKPKSNLTAAQKITITARHVPLDIHARGQVRFGKLDWLGTVELSSASPWFGGFSGLAVDAKGSRLMAISDAGAWLTASIVYRGGRIEKLSDITMGPLKGRDGKVLNGGREADAEAMAFERPGALTGRAYIAFEQRHRIAVVPVTGKGVGPAKRLLPLPGRARSAKGNKGLEAIALLRAGPSKGRLLVMLQEGAKELSDVPGWLIGGGRKPAALSFKQKGGFAVTGMTSLPGGDILILERRFRFSEGVKIRLRRIRAKAIRPGALLEGEILFETDSTREIDNMEGIAAHRDASGRTIVTVISDDNFNRLFQRTLLMQFAIPDQ